MESKYPTKAQITKIRKWDIVDQGVQPLIYYVKSVWWMEDWGFKLQIGDTVRLELHTGGWSGNEDIIEALTRNFIFWSLSWESSRRGGHFYFTINRRDWDGSKEVVDSEDLPKLQTTNILHTTEGDVQE